MNHAGQIEAYLGLRLARSGADLSSDAAGPTLLRELAASVLPSGDPGAWKRRPSISDDGAPVVLSWKGSRRRSDVVRVLIESGSLQMTVPEQIAYSLTKLDDLLGRLEWRSAAVAINAIAAQVFPADASSTLGWRGGMWLGAEVDPQSPQAELRLYLNLRDGSPVERWGRLSRLLSRFCSGSIDPYLAEWERTTSAAAIPVGLGVVVSDGVVRGVRAYVGVENPAMESLETLPLRLPETARGVLHHAHRSFTSRFGAMRRQGITIGYDFVPGAEAPRRVKVDLCCHLVTGEQAPHVVPWIQDLLGAWSFDREGFDELLSDVDAVWQRRTVQFLSLGFEPEMEHATVYVQPSA